MSIDKITKTIEETENLETTFNGVEVKSLIDKINEIIDWINNQ
tara:strand:- start:49 stop:177 length:129 start_codon:yes stop_codon:yes gene_type:complete